MPVRILVDHTADRVRIFPGEGAVEDHLRHRDLAANRFAARLEIDRRGETLLRLGATGVVEPKALGRRHRALVGAGDLPLGGDGFAARRRLRVRRSDCRLVLRRLANLEPVLLGWPMFALLRTILRKRWLRR